MGKKQIEKKRKKPYIKKYKAVMDFDVWFVDGNYVRKKLNPNFCNFAHHYSKDDTIENKAWRSFKFIPKNEFWIDFIGRKSGEEDFFIEHMIIENRLMASGIGSSKAYDYAAYAQEVEREKSKFYIKYKKLKRAPKKLIKKIHKKLFREWSTKKLRVWLVNGEVVRNYVFIPFTAGGHDLVYKFIPRGEVWIDDELIKKERIYTLIHELHERHLMSRGVKYDPAHDVALVIENFARKNPKKSENILGMEIKKQEEVS